MEVDCAGCGVYVDAFFVRILATTRSRGSPVRCSPANSSCPCRTKYVKKMLCVVGLPCGSRAPFVCARLEVGGRQVGDVGGVVVGDAESGHVDGVGHARREGGNQNCRGAANN